MSNDSLHIDQLLNNSFAGFTPALPALAWEGIAAKLDKGGKKGGFAWWQAAAVALIVSGTWFAVNQLSKKADASTLQVKTAPTSIQNDSKSSSNADKVEKAATNSSNSGLNNKSPKTNGVFSPAPYNRSHDLKHVSNPGIGQNLNDANTPIKIENNVEANNKGTQIESTEATNLVIANRAFDIPMGEVSDKEWGTMLKQESSSKVKAVKALPVRPFIALGGHFTLGLGVGQVISNTGYGINPKYAAYVNPMFKENMRKGEGLLSSLSFNATLAYRISRLSVFTGISAYQRKNSQDFNFELYGLSEDRLQGTQQDKSGYYPWRNNVTPLHNGVFVAYKGTSSFSQIEIPLGVMYEYKLGRTWSVIPSLSANIGFITQKFGKTLDYHMDTVTAIKSEWFRKTYYSMNGTLGLYKNFGYSMKIGICGSANYMLTPMYVQGATIRPHAFTGGLSTQLIWRID